MVVETPQNNEITGGGVNEGGNKLVLLSVVEEIIGGA